MAKTFACSDAGVLCHNRVRGESDDEVVAKAVEHAKRAHGVDLSQSKAMMRLVRATIRDDRAGGGR